MSTHSSSQHTNYIVPLHFATYLKVFCIKGLRRTSPERQTVMLVQHFPYEILWNNVPKYSLYYDSIIYANVSLPIDPSLCKESFVTLEIYFIIIYYVLYYIYFYMYIRIVCYMQ